MITIALIAYWGTAVLFIAGLAAAAGRSIPQMDNVSELPVNIAAESQLSLETAA